jgi:secreted PhoX family phosphatase
MDRPEWGAVNPLNNEVYMTLTNSNVANRPVTGTNPANPRSYTDPRTLANGTVVNQTGNPNGHIIRFREAGGDNEAVSFSWDIFLFGADDSLDAQNINISGLNAENEFASPDGLWFARPSNASGQVKPVLWIQTDDGSLTDQTNNQMLAAMPGVVGDGGARTITNTSGATSAQQSTFVGQPASAVDLRRFVVGPRECEITGVDSTPDGRALFINIQHPGEDTEAGDFQQNKYTSNWPASQANPNAVSRPRSATVVITKNDGGVVGL